MSREKQIEEMARKNCHIEYQMRNYKTCKECYETNYRACRVYEVCRNLYNEGYRKQRVGEWKKLYDKAPRYVCTACNHLFNNKSYKYCPNCGVKMKGDKK